MSLFCHLSLSSTHYLDTASSTISDKYLNWKWHHLLPFPTQHCMGCFLVIHLKSVSESLPEFHSLQAMKRKYSINFKLEFWTQQMVFSLVMYSAGGASCLVAPPIPEGQWQCQTLFHQTWTLSVPPPWRKVQQIVSPIPGYCQTLFYHPSSGQATSSEPNSNIFLSTRVANRAIQWNASDAAWWLMQVVPLGGPICNWCKFKSLFRIKRDCQHTQTKNRHVHRRIMKPFLSNLTHFQKVQN